MWQTEILKIWEDYSLSLCLRKPRFSPTRNKVSHKVSPAYINIKILWHDCEGITNLLQQVLELLKLYPRVYVKPCGLSKPQFSPNNSMIILRTGKPIKFVFLSRGMTFPHLNYEL